VIELYWDAENGGFFFTPADHEPLLARGRDVRDGAVPSGNSVQLLNLLRLSVMLGDEELRVRADRMMNALSGPVQAAPWTAERFLAAVDFAFAGPVEIAVVGDPARADTQALLRQIYDPYLPNRVVMLHNPARSADSVKSPLLANRLAVDGKPTAYVCRNYVCRRPVTTPAELAQQLAERS